MMMILYFLPSS